MIAEAARSGAKDSAVTAFNPVYRDGKLVDRLREDWRVASVSDSNRLTPEQRMWRAFVDAGNPSHLFTYWCHLAERGLL